VRRNLIVGLAIVTSLVGCQGDANIAYQHGSPWPKFRGDLRQDGASSVKPPSSGGVFWSYQTGKGIFSSPVVGADGTIYVGSADRTFYALGHDGSLKWKLLTGEIIDSAALLDDRGRVYFGSGDGIFRALDAASGALAWMTPADPPSVNKAFINWFEGNVALSPSGQLVAGNDDFFVYTFDRSSGAIVNRQKVPDQTWSLPAWDGSGRMFVGNNNVVELYGSNLFAFDASGAALWDTYTGVGSVAASPMVTRDGSIVVGGFDGFVRAYDPKFGSVKWEFGARDHIYASPSQLPDGTIVQAAADGTVYGIDPASGSERWEWNGSDPIRSSPSVDGNGNIYFGSGDGRLYALGPDGKLRWSVQLIAADRNDVNASPALGKDAIYIAGESGEVFSVPYDYCLHADGMADARCAPPAAPSLPDDGAVLLWTTPFGSALATPPAAIDPNQPIVLSLVVRAGGRDQLAVIDPSQLNVTFDPPATTTNTVSGDGKFVVIVPSQPFTAAADGTVGLTVQAGVLGNLSRVGLKLSGGSPAGSAMLQFRAKLNAPSAASVALTAPGTTWQMSRLALPLPTLLPSYNQIGFDSLHYLISLVEGDATHGVAWMIGAKLAADQNRTVIDPATQALVPLAYSVAGGYLTLESLGTVTVVVTSAAIPLSTFRLSTALDATAAPQTTLHVSGSAKCAPIPTYGLYLQALGLCNAQTDLVTVSGAANLALFTDVAAPSGVGTVVFAATTDAVTATVTGSSLKLAEHVVSLLLVDAASGAPVSLDYGTTSTRTADASGLLTGASVPIKGKMVPGSVRAYLMIDTTPAAMTTLAVP
jgi:outer membrane protein assembly factor BamB